MTDVVGFICNRYDSENARSWTVTESISLHYIEMKNAGDKMVSYYIDRLYLLE